MATSFQSSVTGTVTIAPFAGAAGTGAAGVGVDGVTMSTPLRLTPSVAVIVADAVDATVVVATENVRLELPAATVTLAGTVATAVLLLDSVTTAPPDGAGPLSVTVPCDEVPPVTVVGDSDSVASDGALVAPGVTVSTVPHVVFSTAHIFACVVDDTLVVPTVKVVAVAPAGTVTVAGTVAGDIAESCTVAPPAGAGAFNVTVAVDDVPAWTVLGLTARDVTQTLTDGLIVTPALARDAPYVAVIVAGVTASTGSALNENRPLVVPAETVTLGGNVIDGSSLERLTST